jgi:NAD(P)-dependent dehydrogenase (short-subunit alcohol dehydrogenase family)
MSRVCEVIEAMERAVPAGKASLDAADIARLRELTAELAAAKPEAAAEYARFLGVKQRGLCLPGPELRDRLGDATVLVTGATGCIGSTLMSQLAGCAPGRLVGLSRGVTSGWRRQPGARYLIGDVRDRDRLDQVLAQVRPDVIFHVAAQRSPALAEQHVHQTVTTNVLGTRNVLSAAAAAGVSQVVCASTGKALRPYSPEMYTASKRAAEWVATSAAASGELLVSTARFTHVIDNSIVYERLLDWADAGTGDGRDDAVVRLHGSSIAFYVQSALESAQLLLLACLGARPGELRVHAITDLGWPVSLVDVALGVLGSKRSRTPVYIGGYDAGYEEVAFPGLYDPATAGDVSPLLNAFETAAAVESPCPMVDAFKLEMRPDTVSAKLLGALESVCARTQDPAEIRSTVDELSWSLLDAALGAARRTAVDRSARLICPHQQTLTPAHRRVADAIRSHASPAIAGAGATVA